MKKEFITPPAPIIVGYVFDTVTKYFYCSNLPSELSGFSDRLRLKETEKQSLKEYSPLVVQSPFSNDERRFHSRLDHVKYYRDIYTGDDYKENEYKNLIIFVFSPDYRSMLLYYFPDYFPENGKRKRQVVSSFLRKRY
ncbi:hypothetical protein [Draconibacterium orientale]|uniref:hypothetical protein n=1 Tax=Draconibacterium orientale TaxID=1168034 RepID=UPI0029C033A8|nr:hypothetical protein [Draconibacterium orientale]